MSKSPNYITPEGFSRLQAEFKELYHEERPKLVETIAWAAGNGDRSENGDYIYGKRRLRQIDSRLKFLRDRIESAQVVNPLDYGESDVVRFGAIVTIFTEDEEEKTYQIVGEDEIDGLTHRISWKAPMAKALLGRQVGDEIKVSRPSGPLICEITKVEYK
jgi:transcription elongation factor GreB